MLKREYCVRYLFAVFVLHYDVGTCILPDWTRSLVQDLQYITPITPHIEMYNRIHTHTLVA